MYDPCTFETCPAPKAHIADPFDCKNFYICDGLNPGSEPVACPSGQFFDIDTHNCQNPVNARCTPPCESCTFECSSSELGRASHPQDCSKYYECSGPGGVTLLLSCDIATPYFDGNKCQNDESKCCACKPTCSVTDANSNALLPNYYNCTKYYQCGDDDKNWFPSYHGTCSTGNFDPAMQSCVAGAPCNEPCSSGGGGPDSCTAEDFVCPDYGYYPVCPSACDRRFYDCSAPDAVGQLATVRICGLQYVFDPTTNSCVLQEDCSVSV